MIALHGGTHASGRTLVAIQVEHFSCLGLFANQICFAALTDLTTAMSCDLTPTARTSFDSCGCSQTVPNSTSFLLSNTPSNLQVVPRSNLQLISVACMLVASKHEEERHPSVQDFTSIADNCFLTGDLLKMEAAVLQCLSFRINAPTSHTFLSLFLQGAGLSPRAQALASYFTVRCTPSG